MDIKVLKNILKMAQVGSLTCAADEAHLTVQALAAQLKKLEEHCGFRLFLRTNKGIALTADGQELLPFIMNVVKSSDQLQQKIQQLRQREPLPLRFSLNSTFSLDINQNIMRFMMKKLGNYRPVFSTSESPDNVQKMAKGESDIAVVIGNIVPDGFYCIPLKGLSIKVVAAMDSSQTGPLTALIKPLPECPYLQSFERFISESGDKYPGLMTLYSGSEIVSISMLKSFGSIGIVSRAMAEQNNLTVLPHFEDVLNVHLVMNEPLLEEGDLEPLYSNVVHLPEIQLTA
ncbi:LysR family transcriptional regulator [Pantoea sp. A4]|uniref:LysR family transcriptional regulator n=1 Tax=Pantoea sp. A4 TaxID=1225184 RepID=UPI000377B8C0|nr:LysR family transcriptional regulator [Pantoea sp. A4]